MPAKKPNRKNKPNQSLDIYRNHHQWDTTRIKRTLDQDKIDWYIYNDLDITEFYNDLKLYNYDDNTNKWKHKKR